MKTVKINFWIFSIIIINIIMFLFYANYNYNYLLGIPGHIFTHNPEKAFRTFLYTWIDTFNFGGSGVIGHSRILIAPLFIILRKIMNAKFIYFFYKFLIITIAGISMFYFSKLIFKEFNDSQNIQMLPFVSAVIYMFNPFTARWASSNIDLITPYALTPAILYFLVKSVSERNFLNTFFVITLLSITLLFNIGSVFVMLTLILLFVVLHSILSKKTEIIKNTFLVLTISFFLTAWYIFPAVYHFLNNVGAWKSIGAMERFYSIRANTIHTLELINAWEMFTTYNGYKIYYFSDIYKNFGIFLVLMPIIAFAPLLFLHKVRKNRYLVISICFICIVGIVLAQGTNPSSPLSYLYKFLLENMPLFNAVRNSTKFNHLIIFAFSLLIPLTLNLVSKKKYLYVILILLLFLYSFPFFSGKLFNPYLKAVPKEIKTASLFINKHNITNAAVLILPGPWLSTYKWLHPYISYPIFLATIDSPIIFRYGGSRPLNIYAKNFLEELYKKFFIIHNNLLSFIRAQYVLIDGTTDGFFYKNNTLPIDSVNFIIHYLNRQNKLSKCFKDGNIIIYKNTQKIYPVFFVSDNISFNRDFLFLFPWNAQQKIEKVSLLNYKKINPTLWKVKVNAKRPFMLSFAEAYDPLWEARIYKNGKKIETVKSIPLYSVINGFWIDQTGDLEIVIRYKPQDWFEIGLVISALTFIGCIGYLFYDWRKNKKVGGQ